MGEKEKEGGKRDRGEKENILICVCRGTMLYTGA